MKLDSTIRREDHRHSKRWDIQGLRGIAILLVVIYHLGLPLPAGFLGVDVFFVISGYVISSLILAEFQSRGKFKISKFFYRRFWRLMPSLALTITVVVLLASLTVPPSMIKNTIALSLSSMLIHANYTLVTQETDYFNTNSTWNPLLHTWSLSVEEQFYLIYPFFFVLILGLYKRGKRRLVYLALSFITVSSLFLFGFGAISENNQLGEFFFGFYSPFSRAWQFLLGALSFFFRFRLRESWHNQSLALLPRGGLIIISSCALLGNSSESKRILFSILISFGAVLILLFNDGDLTHKSILTRKFMIWIGDISYSLYLWHWPLITFAKYLFPNNQIAMYSSLLISLLVSIFVHFKIEQPVKNTMNQNGSLALVVAPVVFIIPFGACVLANNFIYPVAVSRNSVLGNSQHLDVKHKCQNDLGANKRNLDQCTWGKQYGKSVFLIGDSNAGHFSEPLLLATQRSGMRLVIITKSMGQMVDVSSVRQIDNTSWSRDSQLFFQDTMNFLSTQPPSTIILATSDQVWTWPFWQVNVNGVWTSDLEMKAKVYESGLASTIYRMKNMGHRVILIQTVPHIPGDAWDSLNARSGIIPGIIVPPVSFTRSESISNSRFVREALFRLSKNANVQLEDFIDEICDEISCKTKKGVDPIYLDRTHLSVAFSRTLSRRFDALLLQHRVQLSSQE